MIKDATKWSPPSLHTNKERGIQTEPTISSYIPIHIKKEASKQTLPSLQKNEEGGNKMETIISSTK
eukprot:5250820-Ditylum_brightwellii.AAC.1